MTEEKFHLVLKKNVKQREITQTVQHAVEMECIVNCPRDYELTQIVV
jgi:hypothetical protein